MITGRMAILTIRKLVEAEGVGNAWQTVTRTVADEGT